MPAPRPLPKTPSPKSGKSSRITDYFKPIHHSERPRLSKRDLEDADEPDSQPTKKLKAQQERHTTHRFRTVRLRVGVLTPRPRKTPTHTRLLDGTDGGLVDRLVGRYSVQDKKEVVNKEAACPKDEHTRSSFSDRLRNIANNRNTPKPQKRPSSARLVDDVDGGLMDSIVGRFETPRYEEKIAEDDPVNEVGKLEHDNSKDDTPTNKTSMGATSTGDTKDNTNNRDRYTTPSPRPLLSLPEHHGHQSSSPDDQPSDSPSSFLLPSPVADLPAPSSPLSFDSSPIAGPSSPPTQ